VAVSTQKSGPRNSELLLRCECGEIVSATGERELIDKARLHFGEFHPDLGADVPAELIVAMAEQKGA